MDEIILVLHGHQVQTVLDLGCGSGRHLIALYKAGFAVTGMDSAASGLRLAQQWLEREGFRPNLVRADMRSNLPFGENQFEAVLSTQVIHHAFLATVRATTREINRLLQPGGLV